MNTAGIKGRTVSDKRRRVFRALNRKDVARVTDALAELRETLPSALTSKAAERLLGQSPARTPAAPTRGQHASHQSINALTEALDGHVALSRRFPNEISVVWVQKSPEGEPLKGTKVRLTEGIVEPFLLTDGQQIGLRIQWAKGRIAMGRELQALDAAGYVDLGFVLPDERGVPKLDLRQLWRIADSERAAGRGWLLFPKDDPRRVPPPPPDMPFAEREPTERNERRDFTPPPARPPARLKRRSIEPQGIKPPGREGR